MPGKDIVTLRRTIGLKKDEYSIDKKTATKQELSNLLEAAGFSKSNPYYIVPQGRITSLTNAKDHERLGVLRDVAGTSVYEGRRQDSVKLIKETGIPSLPLPNNVMLRNQETKDSRNNGVYN